ncbi:MAG: glycosyltransferase family 2 protein [Phycisphaerae bacterium]
MTVSTDVSVLIVSYNTREMTLDSIRSVYEQTTEGTFEVIVVDNGSSDGSAEAIARDFPHVKLIRRPDNPGFAAGNNLAAKEACGRYLLLLNPDTRVMGGAIDKLLACARRLSDGGAWGGVCVLNNGDVDPGSRQMEPTLKGRLKALVGRDEQRAARHPRDHCFEGVVPVLEGAFMMVRRDLWQQLGGFDESFVMYAEEADLCRRIRDAGYRIYMTGLARILHFSGASETDTGRRTLQKTRGLAHYFRKHYHAPCSCLASVLIWLHALQRLLGGMLLTPLHPERGRRLRERFGTVACCPWQWWSGWRDRRL